MKAQTPNDTQGQKAIEILEAPERWGVKLPPRPTSIPLSDSTARLIQIYQLVLFIAELYGNRDEVYFRRVLAGKNVDIEALIEKQYIRKNECALKALEPFLKLVETELSESIEEYVNCPYKESNKA